MLFYGVPNSSGSTAGLSGTTAEVGSIPGWTAADLGFYASIYSSCKPPFWDKPHIVNPRRFVTSPDIVKYCWLAPVVFSPPLLEGFFHVKSRVLCSVYLSFFVIVHLVL